MTHRVADAAAAPRPDHAEELASRYGLRSSAARPTLSAYIAQLWSRRHFVVALARARTSAQYSDSILGQLWQVLTPLLNAAVYFFIFGLLLKTRAGIPNYTAFLVAGVFAFNYSQRAILTGARSISGNLELVRALHFPRATLPLAATITELQQLLVATVVLAAIVVATGEPVTLHWLLLVPAFALQTLFNAGLALVFGRLTSRVRDLEQLLPFVVRTWQYTSGIFFSLDAVGRNAPAGVRLLLDVNPGAVYIEIVRDALLDSHVAAWYTWPLAVAWALVVFVSGFVYFWRAEERYGRG